MKIVFMGSPGFAMPSLELLYNDENINVAGVFSQPAKKSGRKMQLHDTPVASFAKEHNIQLHTPAKLTEDYIDIIKDINPDLICVIAYGLILPEYILNIAPCINVHPSSLPRFRGAAPLQYTLINGDEKSDLCIMAMEKGLDTGEVYKRVSYDIAEDLYLEQHHDNMASQGAKHLLDVVLNWEDYKTKGIKQTEDGLIYAHKINKPDQKIDFNKDVKNVYDLIRGISPVPCAYAKFDETSYKIYKSSIVSLEDNNYDNGQIVYADKNNGLVIACKKGLIRLNIIQKPGKGKVTDVEILNGLKLNIGDCFD